jgi:predicted DNA binding CopG/RHH family protein
MKTRQKKVDAQLEEFEKRDLGKDIQHSHSAAIIRPKHRSLPTSILLDPSIIVKLKEKAHGRGIGYQTMLKIILHEHVNEY